MLGDQLGGFLRSSSGGILAGAIVVLEVVAGAIVAPILAFFMVKDGPRLQQRALHRLPQRHQEAVVTAGLRRWSSPPWPWLSSSSTTTCAPPRLRAGRPAPPGGRPGHAGSRRLLAQVEAESASVQQGSTGTLVS
ncbi:MAG TPA: hypothetical protein VGL92_17590 [Acidimicrobiia bacterium]